MRGNFEEYIEKCKIVHNNKYDYSKAIEPRTTSDNITIICPIHGEFQQPLKNHLEGKGCKKCARIKQNVNLLSEIQKKEIINKANSEDDKIIYNKIESVNRSYKIFGMCNHINKKGNIHGAFSVSLSHYKRGSRCPKCGYERLSCTTEEVIDKCKKTDFGKDLIYDKFIYYGSSIKSIFTCPIHGDFEMTPNNLLAGHICKECAKLNRISKRTKTTEQFIDECIKKYGTDRYGFWRVNYKGNSELVEIWCYNCHSYFKILPSSFLNGNGCSHCKISHIEIGLEDFLKNKNISYEYQKNFKWLHKKSLDFYINEYNVAIECQGIQHFKSVEFFGGDDGLAKTIQRDNLKKKLCEENGVKLLYYSNLNIEYPYKVFEDKDELLKEIINSK